MVLPSDPGKRSHRGHARRQQIEQCTLVLVGLVLSLPHAKNTLDTYGPIGPDRYESTRAAVDSLTTARPVHRRNSE